MLLLQGGFSSIKNFKTPPLAYSDCLSGSDSNKGKNSKKPGDLEHCLKDVEPVRVLLAADNGQNNNGDNSWLADGQGFAVYDLLQSAPGNVLGPWWPGKTYTVGGVPLPVGNYIFAMTTWAGYTAWGFQVQSSVPRRLLLAVVKVASAYPQQCVGCYTAEESWQKVLKQCI
jgi:hypothetical protein